MKFNKSSIALILLFFITFLTTNLYCQILKPIKWNFSVNRINDDEADLILKASIEKKWHLYSQFIPANGPIPTSFKFAKSKDYELVGKVKEPKPITENDPNFDMVLKFFAKEAIFIQRIKVLSKTAFTINGSLEFMCCDDSKCLPPEEIKTSFRLEGNKNITNADIKSNAVINDTSKIVAKDTSNESIIGKQPIVAKAPSSKASSSLWWIFILGFGGGLIALLTPCVFPMIPMTVSFFLKRGGKKSKGIRDALIYGVSIVVIYVLLGLGVTLIFGADALNALSTNAIFNVFFFALLVVFAAAFLGAFELQLPASWVNKMDTKADKASGFIAIFFMAFTLALVSFSCTGPIIGTLLVEAVSRGTLAPLVGMAGFAIALSIPFTVFAIIPGWLKSMPKSGGWLNSVKVVLGFLELALALKFLSTADLVSHWGILPRETFLVLWIIIFTLLGFYLLGKLKFAHDSDLNHISVTRLFLAIVSLSFALYMVPGLWGAPLKAISAFSPPQMTQDFDLTRSTSIVPIISIPESSKKKFADLFHCPSGLNCFFDFDDGMAEAKKLGKPVFVDFTGWGCVNCRKMEVSVWSDKEVLQRLNNDYVLISLYVDDKTELPKSEQYISKFSQKEIKTIGNKWSDLQATKYGSNSQPYYVLLDNDGKLLAEPHAFDLNIQTYIDFLDSGTAAYKKLKTQK